MDARLSLKTCDKCGKVMKKGDKIIVLTEGTATRSNELLLFRGEAVQYACHQQCWDGYASLEN